MRQTTSTSTSSLQEELNLSIRSASRSVLQSSPRMDNTSITYGRCSQPKRVFLSDVCILAFLFFQSSFRTSNILLVTNLRLQPFTALRNLISAVKSDLILFSLTKSPLLTCLQQNRGKFQSTFVPRVML